MATSLIGIKSVTYALVVVQFFLICIADKTVLQLSMIRDSASIRGINASESLDPSETQPLLEDQPHLQVLSRYTKSFHVFWISLSLSPNTTYSLLTGRRQ